MMNVNQLKETDPRRFEKEYQKWMSNALDYEWWDFVYEQFQEDCQAHGFDVDLNRTYFSLGYCQSDHASFEAVIDFSAWMTKHGYDQKYLALWLDVQEYGDNVASYRGNRAWVNFDYRPGYCNPSGVFSDLPVEAWDALCEEQWAAEDWEKLLLETCRELEDDLYRRLRDEYEHLTSEDAFVDSCMANETEFDEE